MSPALSISASSEHLCNPQVKTGPFRPRSLVLGGQAPPRRAKKVGEQSIALRIAARVHVMNHPQHERGGGYGVQAIWFHLTRTDAARSRTLPAEIRRQ